MLFIKRLDDKLFVLSLMAYECYEQHHMSIIRHELFVFNNNTTTVRSYNRKINIFNTLGIFKMKKIVLQIFKPHKY